MTATSSAPKPPHVLIVGGRDHTVKKVQALGLRFAMIQSSDLVSELQFKQASRYLVTDYKDLEEVIETAKLWHALDPFDAVVSFAEYGLHAASVCANVLGLPGGNEQAVLMTRDKFRMRQLLREHQLSAVDYALCQDEADVRAFFDRLGGRPMVLKPFDGGGSIGISYVDAAAGIPDAWAWTRNACKGRILAEEFLEGQEYSVESISRNGRHEVVMITEKLTTQAPHFIELGHQMPARLSPETRQAVVDTVTRLLDVVEQQTAPAHTEIRVGPQGVKIIESQTRIGGDQIWEMTELVSGVDLMSETLCELLGLPAPARRPVAPAAAIRFFARENEQIESVANLDRATSSEGVVRLSCTLKAGQRLGKLTWSESRQGYALCQGETVEQAVENAERAVAAVQVTATPFEPLKLALAFPIGPLSLGRYLAICQRQGWEAVVVGAESFREQARAAGADLIVADIADFTTADAAAAAASIDSLVGRLRGERVQGVVPGGEYSVAVSDRIAAGLGLPHNPLDQGLAFRNKASMRARFAEFNVPQPKVLARFSHLDEAQAFDWRGVRFPVIVKPIDMASSMFVRACHTEAEARELLVAMFGFVDSGSDGLPFSKGALVEELAVGPEYSAECLVENGRLKDFFLTTKFVSPWPYCNEVGHLSGDRLAPEVEAQLLRAIAGIVTAWGVTHTVMHVEFKLTPDGIRVIEAGNRVAGDRISELVELRYGVSLEECFCRLRAQVPLRIAPTRDNAQAPFVGVKFYFDAERAPSESLTIVREEVWAPRVAMTPMVHDIKQRLGFRIVSSADRNALEQLIAVAGAPTSAGVPTPLPATTAAVPTGSAVGVAHAAHAATAAT
ncbi:ATP-grasp domain-containing protein [Roseateles amylovorans]|uniref:ATP-grasp domain-containing protein n=1 Tax=Roseateles amylovorans TaxID=2978473 RepID=A0ABY6AXE8_9BURK|nr:ATP-grasp domain-containing protein [Roseateles amylovorans]UXH77470.1 ATP-grasp domain-containing protein [Roseateles amylovorans]